MEYRKSLSDKLMRIPEMPGPVGKAAGKPWFDLRILNSETSFLQFICIMHWMIESIDHHHQL